MSASTTRAYSILQIKSVSDDSRSFTGIASTPETDRDGDILEPKGASFKLPIPILLRHNQAEPIGFITAAKVTSNGIEVTGKLTQVDEPGKLKDRLDLAWQEMKAGLLRGLSVGFKSIESARIDGTNGIRFLKWLWLELSAVTIPSNAEATILSIKSLSQSDLNAASGVTVPATHAASGVSRQKQSPMKISEQLTAKQAELKTKATQLETLHTAEELTADQVVERDTLTDEVKSLTNDVERLSVLEKAMGANLRVATPIPQTQNGGGQTFEVKEPELPPGIGFARYVICKMAATLNHATVMDIAKAKYPSMGSLHTYIKSAVEPGTTTVGSPVNTWASDLVYPNNLVSEFIEFLRPKTIIGKFGAGSIPSLRRVPFNVRMIGQTSGGAANWVGEAIQKPVTKYDFTPTTLTWAKVAAICVLSDELARFSSPSAEALVRDALTGTLVDKLDTDFVDPAKAVSAGVSPASITNSSTAINPTGLTAAALRTDLATLIGRFITADIDLSQGVFIMPTALALNISLLRNALGNKEFPDLTMNGGNLEGLPVITSQYAAVASPVENMLILVAANEIFLSDDGQVSIDMSREATIEMETDPAGATGTNLNMFQSNLLALRAERYINWAKRRTAAVQYIQDAVYSG